MLRAITSIVMATAGAALMFLGIAGLVGNPIMELGKYTPGGRDFGLQVLLSIIGASLLAWAVLHYKIGKK